MTARHYALGLAGAAAAGAAVATVVATRRWAANIDPDEGEVLLLPKGDETLVQSADGAKLAVHVAGSGDRTFVLAHGWTNDRRIWGPVARRLVDRGHRVVTYDQRGHAGSTVGSDGLTIEAIGADLRAVIDHADARDIVVAGHSMGGMAAQAYAIAEPAHLHEHVRALVLVATGCGGVGARGPGARFAPAIIGSERVIRAVSSKRLGPLWMRNTVGRRASLAHLRAMQENFVATPAEARSQFLVAMTAMDHTAALGAVDVPTVVVCGTHDQLTPEARSRELAAAIPGARLEIVPDAGHMLQLEEPDLLVELLESAGT
jgi:pimeloyl-ACP methyl ester carboxylesterase